MSLNFFSSKALLEIHTQKETTPSTLFYNRFPKPFFRDNQPFLDKYNDLIKEFQYSSLRLIIGEIESRLEDIEETIEGEKQNIINSNILNGFNINIANLVEYINKCEEQELTDFVIRATAKANKCEKKPYELFRNNTNNNNQTSGNQSTSNSFINNSISSNGINSSSSVHTEIRNNSNFISQNNNNYDRSVNNRQSNGGNNNNFYRYNRNNFNNNNRSRSRNRFNRFNNNSNRSNNNYSNYNNIHQNDRRSNSRVRFSDETQNQPSSILRSHNNYNNHNNQNFYNRQHRQNRE